MTHPLACLAPATDHPLGATTAQRIATVKEAMAIAIPVAAAAGSAFFGVGAPVAAAAATVASALTMAGIAISGAAEDQFQPSVQTSAALVVLASLYPFLLFEGVDDVGAGKPEESARVMRYLLVSSGMTAKGTRGNTGRLHNPRAGDVWALTQGVGASRACRDNPYLCAADPDHPLTDTHVVAKVAGAYRAWKAESGKAADLARVLPLLPERPNAATAAALLTLVRGAPGAFSALVSDFRAVRDHRAEVAEAVRAARRAAGESGPDPVLSAIFGDVSVPATADAPLGAAPAGGAPCPEPPSRLGWFAFGILAAAAAAAGLAVNAATPTARAAALADALDAYWRTPSRGHLDRVYRTSATFASAARRLDTAEGVAAAERAAWQSSALGKAASRGNATNLPLERWATAWRTWHEL